MAADPTSPGPPTKSLAESMRQGHVDKAGSPPDSVRTSMRQGTAPKHPGFAHESVGKTMRQGPNTNK